MPNEYQKDGDLAFIGLNSRDNPSALPAGIVSKSNNFRFDRGVATVRKGLKRKTSIAVAGQNVYGSGTYLNSSGQEVFLIVVTDGLYTYNPNSDIWSVKFTFPAGETITTQDGCDVVHAIDKVFITRGFAKRPLVWDMGVTVSVLPALGAGGSGAQFPNCKGLIYYSNRLAAIGADHTYTLPSLRSRDSVSISNFLSWHDWDSLDSMTFNNGGNDDVVAVSPWTTNEALVFMRNSIFYASFGVSRYVTGEPLSTDSYVRTLVTDIGCMAKRSVVQANGGVMFLSDNGVYFLQPSQVGSNDAMRLMTIADPISSPIDDIIQRINRTYAHRCVATYWNNRYYLAVPLDNSVDNNAILVYNFILKNWESIDSYPAGFDVFNFLIGKKDNQRRLFAVDSEQGVFMMEELEHDEYGNGTGTPVLPFYLPALLSSTSFTPNPIQASLKTRRYSFGDVTDKRFSTIESEMVSAAGGVIFTNAEVANPDSTTLIDTFGFSSAEDSRRSVPVRKIGTGLQVYYESVNLRPSIRSTFVYATIQRKQNKSIY